MTYFCLDCGKTDHNGSNSDQDAICLCGADNFVERDDVVGFFAPTDPEKILTGVITSVMLDDRFIVLTGSPEEDGGSFYTIDKSHSPFLITTANTI